MAIIKAIIKVENKMFSSTTISQKGISSIYEAHREAYSLNGMRRDSKHKFIPNDLSKFKGHSHKKKENVTMGWSQVNGQVLVLSGGGSPQIKEINQNHPACVIHCKDITTMAKAPPVSSN